MQKGQGIIFQTQHWAACRLHFMMSLIRIEENTHLFRGTL